MLRGGFASLRSFRRAQRGATAVEFGLVAVPFFFLIACSLEGGIMLFTQHQLQNAVQEAGRLIRTRQVTTQGGFINKLCDSAATLQNCSGTVGSMVRSGASFTVVDQPRIDPLSVGPGSGSFTPGKPGDAVVVVATYDWRFIFPLMKVFSNTSDNSLRRLHGIAAFQNEP